MIILYAPNKTAQKHMGKKSDKVEQWNREINKNSYTSIINFQ